MFFTWFSCCFPLGILSFLKELASKSFSINTSYLDNSIFRNYIPYYDHVVLIFVIEFILVFVYSMSISYAGSSVNGGNGINNGVFIGYDEEEMEEGTSLLTINE